MQSKELKAARQEMARASKGEQQMRTVVHRMRSEAKQMEEVNEALQQRVKALMKENAYTLEQLQAARKMEREQKVIIAGMRSKLQLTQATQEEIDRLASEYKDVKQQLIRSNHDRDIFSASNNHLKEELAEVTKALHIVKVEKAQIESDFGTNCTLDEPPTACSGLTHVCCAF
jgi:malonyl CoA-acyl carrier protein transacylase